MNSLKLNEEQIIKILDKKIDFKYLDRIVSDFDIELDYAKSVIKSSVIAEFYTEIKGKRECKLLGINSKSEFLDIILLLSKKYGWVAFESITNKGSLIRKLRLYNQNKDSYERLAFLVSKKQSNRVQKNARKITDDQLKVLNQLFKSSADLSEVEIYNKLKEKDNTLAIGQRTITHYKREFVVGNFKERYIDEN